MSDTISNEKKNFVLSKNSPGDVFFILHPASNPTLAREISLNKRVQKQALPVDWALGVFLDPGIYTMYKKGIISFDDNEAIKKIAIDSGVYFDETDFVEVPPNRDAEILSILSTGNREKIVKAIDTYGKDVVKDIVKANVSTLKSGIVTMLEKLLNIQLVLDNA